MKLLPLALLAAPLSAQTHSHDGLPPHEHGRLQPADGDWIYYDWVDEGGTLRGGRIEADPRNELHADVGTPLGAPAAEGAGVVTLIDNGPPQNRLDLVFVGDGYTASELGFYASHVNAILPVFLNEPPLSDYASLINVHRVDVVSNESGVDNDPVQGIQKDTALDMQYWCSGIERLLCVSVGKANAQASLAPGRDQVLALANSSKYGGGGYSSSDLATVAGNNGLAIDIALHELGHSLGNLADEYTYGGPTTYTGGEPGAANASILNAAAMAAQQQKWHLWLSEPNVSTFEGAMYSVFGIYRPTSNSMMRNLGRPFEQVNVEQLVLQIYGIVSPIDDASAPGTYLDDVVLFVDPIDPSFHALDVEWSIDGVPIPGATAEQLDVSTLALAPGFYTVSARVTDNTPLVRDEAARAALMSEERSWNVAVPGSPQPPILANVSGPIQAAGTTPFVINGAFLDTATAVRIDGQPAAIQAQSFDTLTVAPTVPGVPGYADLEADGPGGTGALAGALAQYPILTATTTGIGGTLTVSLDSGLPFWVFHALAVSGGTFPAPLVLPGIDYGLVLDVGFAFQIADAGSFISAADVVFNVPSLPSLSGSTLWLQAHLAVSGLPPSQSFTNAVGVTF